MNEKVIKVIHFESGLGNQMLDYADYLACKHANPKSILYKETYLYDISNKLSVNMWNGYELESIFNIKIPDVKTLFSETENKMIIKHLEHSKFWTDNWRYSHYLVNIFASLGLVLNDKNPRPPLYLTKETKFITVLRRFIFTRRLGMLIKKIVFVLFKNHFLNQVSKKHITFEKNSENEYKGHYLCFLYKNNDIERIDQEIRSSFVFPKFVDIRNIQMSKQIQDCNSVSIHFRLDDMMDYNKRYLKNNYYKRAINFIEKKVKSPQYFLFGTKSSLTWVKNNLDKIGFNKDNKIYYIDWNKDGNSYRDMQLMAKCKHNIITYSTFGWWGSYLNQNKSKITVSPDIRFNTTNYV